MLLLSWNFGAEAKCVGEGEQRSVWEPCGAVPELLGEGTEYGVPRAPGGKTFQGLSHSESLQIMR